jgi:hypothetical protein
MADAGVRSTNITNRASLADEVIVNRAGSTGLQTIQDLATQLAGSGALASAINALALAASADYTRISLSALNAVAGATNGQTGIVLVGNDRGIYERQAGVWVKVVGLPSDTGQAAAEAAAALADADRIVAQAAASEALGHRTAAEATEDRIEASTAMITNYRGAWATGTAYAVRDTVMQSGVQYICTVAHVGGTFATDLAAPKWQLYQGATVADLASQASAALGAGMVGYGRQGTTVASRLDGVSLLEGKHNLRDFYKALYAYNSGFSPAANSNGFVGIGFYGDSVSPHVWSQFLLQLFHKIPQGAFPGTTTGNVTGGGGWTTTGTVIRSDTASVNQTVYDGAGGVADFTYLPGGDHVELADAATITIDLGGQPGFATVRAYMATGPGMGTAQVELINRDTSAVIDTQTVNLSGASLGATKVQWATPNVVASGKYRIRVTATGKVVVFPNFSGGFGTRGIVPVKMGRGGCTLAQNNYSSNAIMTYLINEFNMKLMFVQAKEENASVSIPAMFTRFASLPVFSVLVIGSLPDVTSEASQLATQKIWRDNAMANYAAYFDGYRACRNYTELVRLGWITDGTHPLDPANRFVAQLLHDELGILNAFGTKEFRNVSAAEVKAQAFKIPQPGGGGDEAATIDFVQAFGGGAPTVAVLRWIRSLTFGDPIAGGTTPVLSIYGNDIDLSTVAGDGAGLRLGRILDLRTQGTQTTAPSGGGAGALPANPAGYMVIGINGTTRRIPYY